MFDVNRYIRIIFFQARFDCTGNTACQQRNHVRLPLHRWSEPSSSKEAGSISRASNMASSSSKVRTKSTSLRTVRRIASSFLEGAWSDKYDFCVRLFLFYLTCSGNHRCQFLRNIVDHGRENVSSPAWTRKDSRRSEGTGRFSGSDFFRHNGCASETAPTSAPRATS